MWTLLFGSSRCKKQQNPTEGLSACFDILDDETGQLDIKSAFLGSLTSPFQ